MRLKRTILNVTPAMSEAGARAAFQLLASRPRPHGARWADWDDLPDDLRADLVEEARECILAALGEAHS